jgi:hypothetical protein
VGCLSFNHGLAVLYVECQGRHSSITIGAAQSQGVGSSSIHPRLAITSCSRRAAAAPPVC